MTEEHSALEITITNGKVILPESVDKFMKYESRMNLLSLDVY